MAKHPRRPSGPARKGKAAPSPRARSKNAPTKKKVVFDAPAPEPEEPRTFRLGTVEGATVGRWVDAWKQRMPQVPLELEPMQLTAQRARIDELDAALVRLPLADDALHVIPLYEEVPVVVAAIDSHLLAAEELHTEDLTGEVIIPLADDPLGGVEIPGTVRATFAPLSATDAIATAASGTGVVVLPMSLARLHHRKDADYRVLADGPTSTVALAWLRERTTPDVETFVGIVRGRTANSSR